MAGGHTTPPKNHLYQAHSFSQSQHFEIKISPFPELSSTSNSLFLSHSSVWEKDEVSHHCDCWETGPSFVPGPPSFRSNWKKRSPVPQHSHNACLARPDHTSALLSAAARYCFYHIHPALSFEDILSLAFCPCFPEQLKKNYIIQFSVYSCLNFENKVCSNSRINITVFQFGKVALQLFACFLFLQVFDYCHEVMKFMVLI